MRNVRGRGGVTGTTLRLRRPAEPAELRTIRRHVAAWAQRHALSEDVLADLQLAVGEAVANGVEHAYPEGTAGTVEVELTVRAGAGYPAAVLVRVLDHGRWRPTRAADGYRGHGLALIGRLAQRLEVIATGNGTQVCFELPVRS